ncbi:MAG: site-specific DNA-methyltransferase [Rubripirellula sp.]|nr:site-specific DNA-methyltransferase [Rubripirellula sp.]
MDPPYNVSVSPRSKNAIAAGNSTFTGDGKKAKGKQKMRAKDRPLANDFISEAEFDRLLLEWFENASRVLVPGGAAYIWGGYANLGNYPEPMKQAGLYFSQAIVWDKKHPVMTRKDFMGAFELCQPGDTIVRFGTLQRFAPSWFGDQPSHSAAFRRLHRAAFGTD